MRCNILATGQRHLACNNSTQKQQMRSSKARHETTPETHDIKERSSEGNQYMHCRVLERLQKTQCVAQRTGRKVFQNKNELWVNLALMKIF